MRPVAKTLIVLLMLAALPLRGYAAMAIALCEAHHGGEPAAHLTVQGHGADQGDGPREDDQGSAPRASICGMCAGCCVGTSFAPGSVRPVVIVAPAPDRIPFLGAWVSGHLPEHLDRPPLAL